jgi:glyoxylase-like metal-dependent hydrolase (beta-lactamase superfamily II)
MLTLGPATVERIVDIDRFTLPLGMIFPGATLDALAGARDWLDPHHVDFAEETVLLGVQSHLLRVGGKIILIDTCVGEHKPRPRRPDWHDRQATGYLTRLKAAGVRPGDVDAVFCTHLHADHVGWNTRLDNGRWAPTFPNARYLIGRAELAHWAAEEARAPGEANHGAYADSVLPVIDAGLAEEVDDGADLGLGLAIDRGTLRALDLAGHSPGQIGLCLRHAHGRAIFCGDAIHSPAQLHRPDWVSAFCADPDRARATRARMLEDAAGDGALIVPGHLRGPMAFRPEPCATPVGAAWRPVWA